MLREIIENPEDDGLRLIYADWLADHGEPVRAEFIRVQVEIERGAVQGERLQQMREAENRIWWLEHDQFGNFLIQADSELPGLLNMISRDDAGQPQTLMWRRGFPHTVRCSLAYWLRHGSQAAPRLPLSRVELTDRRPLVVSFGRAAWFLGNGDWLPPVEQPPDYSPHWLPPDWLRHFRGYEIRDGYPDCLEYRTAALALDALSEAALAWARAAKKGGAGS